MGWEGKKSSISLFLGFGVGAIGLIPLLNAIGVIGWTLPPIPEMVLLIILVIGGSYLAVDGFMEIAMTPGIGWVSILLGVTTAIIGVLRLLGKAAFFAFLIGTPLNILFVIIGILLIIGAFMF